MSHINRADKRREQQERGKSYPWSCSLVPDLANCSLETTYKVRLLSQRQRQIQLKFPPNIQPTKHQENFNLSNQTSLPLSKQKRGKKERKKKNQT